MGFIKSLLSRMRVPDFEFAAKGFVQVAITRRYSQHIDLHKLERGYAAELMDEGCTLEQALSARWGGVEAIHDDLVLFDLGIQKGKEEATEACILPQTDGAAGKAVYLHIYRMAADFALRCTWEADHDRYGRFVRHVRA